MYFVYILQSQNWKNKFYVGITENLTRRLTEHNDLKYRSYTKLYAPWRLSTYIAFEDKDTAERFEQYLKGHSGKTFLKKRLIKRLKDS